MATKQRGIRGEGGERRRDEADQKAKQEGGRGGHKMPAKGGSSFWDRNASTRQNGAGREGGNGERTVSTMGPEKKEHKGL